MIWDPVRHPAVAMPVGGIGTGSLAMGSDGGWRQTQLMNLGKHTGDLPGTFMALRVMRHVPVFNRTVVLQQAREDGRQPSTPMVDDDLVPDWQRDLLEQVGGTRTTMHATYPVATVEHDTSTDVDVQVRVSSPMQPTDLDASAVPVAMIEATLTNMAPVVSRTWLAHSLMNSVGLDPHLNPRGTRAPGLGGNTNTFDRRPGGGTLRMDNPSVEPLSPWYGQLVLSCQADLVVAMPCFEDPTELVEAMGLLAPWGDHSHLDAGGNAQFAQPSGPSERFGPSPPGSTWLGALVGYTELQPGESRTVRFTIAWHFPNRYADFVQFGPPRPEHGRTRFWLGNHYATRWRDAVAVTDAVLDGWDDFWAPATAWARTMESLPLPAHWRTHLATQAVTLRTPTAFRTADGACFGFEGVLGASTPMWSGQAGGSCPLNCTHVWNYAQAASAIWPAWERSMRETELDIMLAPSGALPHRVYVPTYLRQLGDGPVGGPDEPALDGMCGAVLKTYRELRRGAVGVEWVIARWAAISRLMDHIAHTWDPENEGLLSGVQPSTHDVGLNGANTFMGTYWLAALRAAEELAKLVGDHDRAVEWRGRFELSSRALDAACFRGDYYVQLTEPALSDRDQWGSGCLSDQLIGQWWAHTLGLGHLLPEEHVRAALASIVRYNLVDDPPVGHDRPFAIAGERGLLLCTWPRGGRPQHPTMYSDEVWTGSEYQVAAHCFYEGMDEEGAAIVEALWSRHDGRRRNPFNEVECGDHYVRAMAGWSVLEARLGMAWNALGREFHVGGAGTFPLMTGSGWGVVESGSQVVVRCLHGSLEIDTVVVAGKRHRVLGSPIQSGQSTTLRAEGQ